MTVTETCVTVRVESRGRITIPDAAREALDIFDSKSLVRLTITVVDPFVEGPVETGPDDDPRVDDRGRLTIPSEYRDRLDIDDKCIVKLTITLLENHVAKP